MDRTHIWTAPDADELQRFAALELQRYLRRLFSVPAQIVTESAGPPATRFHALVEKELLSDGSVHVREARAAREAADHDLSDEHLRQARDLFERAIKSGEAALRASASQARDDSDRASLAAYHHFFVREVRDRTSAVLADGAGASRN